MNAKSSLFFPPPFFPFSFSREIFIFFTIKAFFIIKLIKTNVHLTDLDWILGKEGRG